MADRQSTTDYDQRAERRIIDDTELENRVTRFNIREGDLGMVFGLPVAGILLAGLLDLEFLGLPLMGVGFAIGLIIVIASPGDQSAWSWIKNIYRHRRSSSVISRSLDRLLWAGESESSEGSPQSDSEKATQDLLNFQRAWPGMNAIERSDGAMEAFIEVSPDNMDFAQSGDWAQLQKAGKEFANKELDFPFKFYATTQEFPVGQVVAQIDDRLEDDEVQENPVLRELLEEYREKRPEELRERGIQQLRYFIGVEVNRFDVYSRYRDEKTWAERLQEIPFFGIFFNPIVGRGESLDRESRRQKMGEKLEERINTVRTNFIQDCSGWTSRRLSTAEMFALTSEFWNGEVQDIDTLESVLEEPSEITVNETTVNIEDDEEEVDPWRLVQKAAIAPKRMELESRSAQVGSEWVRTLLVTEYPDFPMDSYLNELFEMTDVRFDLTVNLRPRNQKRAERELKRRVDRLRTKTTLGDSADEGRLGGEAAKAQETYQAATNGQRVFDQTVLVTVRADTREDLEDAVYRLNSRLRDHPANVDPKSVAYRQDLGLESASPIGMSQLDQSATVLGGAVGALFASLHDPTVLEEGGVEVGIHRKTRDTMVVDAFARENGYAMFVVGDPGAGKSFDAKLNFIRSIAQNDDQIGFILEPMNNWRGVAEALDAQQITIGGSLGLNPLEIQPTPEEVQRRLGEDANPFNEKLDDVMSFFRNYFAQRGVTLGDRLTTLELGLRQAYAENGITEDIGTHGNESPTIRDMMDVLEAVIEDPGDFVMRSEAETGKLREDAKWLLSQLRPFEEGGRYEHLGRPTEFDLQDEEVVYLSLGQEEGSFDSEASLEMQLLISLVYERAKQTQKKSIFAIDEAHYVMQDSANLSFLETVFRHHRHHDLSIRLITQTVDEFFRHPESEAILDQCAIKQFHQLDGMDEGLAAEFGLNFAQMRFVQDAALGSDEGRMSEALLGIDGEWRGIEIQAMPTEKQVIDFDPDEPSDQGLPGMDDEQVDIGQETAADGGGPVGSGETEEEREKRRDE